MSLRRRDRKKEEVDSTVRALTAKEKKLVAEFEKDCDLSAAMTRANYRPDIELKSNWLLKKAITDVMERNSKEIEVTHNDLLRRLQKWYDSDITATVGLTKEELQKLDPELRKLITKYKYRKKRFKQGGEWVLEEYFECEFVSKEKALDMVARHIGFFSKDNVEAQLQFNMSELSETSMRELRKMIAGGQG